MAQVLVQVDRRHPDVPERAVVGLAHLRRVAVDLRGIDDGPVVGVGLHEGVAEGDARGAIRGAPVVEVHDAVFVAVERRLVHVEDAPHRRRRVHAGVGGRAAEADLLAGDEEELDGVLPAVALEEPHRLQERRAAGHRVVGALRVVGVVGGALRDGVVVDDEDDLLALRVVDLGGESEDEVLPRLGALGGGAAGVGRGVALARRVRRREAPAGGLHLEVLAGERVAQGVSGVVRREHVVRGAGADAAGGAEAGDGHVAVAREVADELEPARLARRVDDLLDERESRPRRQGGRLRGVGGVDLDGRQRDARHAVEEGVEFAPRELHPHLHGEEVEHRSRVDLEADGAGEGRGSKGPVVGEDVDRLAVVGGAPERRHALSRSAASWAAEGPATTAPSSRPQTGTPRAWRAGSAAAAKTAICRPAAVGLAARAGAARVERAVRSRARVRASRAGMVVSFPGSATVRLGARHGGPDGA